MTLSVLSTVVEPTGCQLTNALPHTPVMVVSHILLSQAPVPPFTPVAGLQVSSTWISSLDAGFANQEEALMPTAFSPGDHHS